MSHWLKLALPLLLGCAAAALNWYAVWSRIAPREFVRVNKQIDVGEGITPNDLEMVQIAGDLGTLPETAVPWEDQALVHYRTARRILKKGDLVLHQDLSPQSGRKLPPGPGEMAIDILLPGGIPSVESIELGSSVSFLLLKDPSQPSAANAEAADDSLLQRLGPFRVLAVNAGASRSDGGRDGAHNVLTVAVRESLSGVPDETGSRLIIACTNPRGERILRVLSDGDADGRKQPRAVARAGRPS